MYVISAMPIDQPMSDPPFSCNQRVFSIASVGLNYTRQKNRNDSQLPLMENKLKQEECGISVKLRGNQTKFIN